MTTENENPESGNGQPESGNEEMNKGPDIPYPEFTGEGEKKELTLPVGSFDSKGEYYRKVLYGPLTGLIRKKFSKPSILNNPGKLVTAVLVEILEFPHDREMTPEDKKLTVRAMYSADRAWCVFAIRAATSKLSMVQKMNCPYCGDPLEIHTSPNEIKVYKIEETGYKLKRQEKEHILDYTSSWGSKFTFGLARGFSEEELTPHITHNLGEAAHSVLAAATKTIDGNPVDPTMFDTWSTGKTDELFDEFSSNQPGPETLMEVECVHCSKIVEYGVDPADFLLPNVRRRRSRRTGGK